MPGTRANSNRIAAALRGPNGPVMRAANAISPSEWRHNRVADVIAAALQLLLAYAVASLSWKFIETPILKLKRSFQSRAGFEGKGEGNSV